MTHFVLGILRKVVKGSNMQFELATLGEFAKTCPEADEVRAGNGDCETHRRFRHIENTVFLQPEAMRLILTVNKMHEVLALGTARSSTQQTI